MLESHSLAHHPSRKQYEVDCVVAVVDWTILLHPEEEQPIMEMMASKVDKIVSD